MIKNQMIDTKNIAIIILALSIILSCDFLDKDASPEDHVGGEGIHQIELMDGCIPDFRNPTDHDSPILAEVISGSDKLNTEILMQAIIVDNDCEFIINREKITFVSTGLKYSDGANAVKDFQVTNLSIFEWTYIEKDYNGKNLYRVGFNVVISSNLIESKEYFIHPTWDINFYREGNFPPERVGGIVAHFKFNPNGPNPNNDGDGDGDGIMDSLDACPDQGDQGDGLSPNGCPKPPPDGDGDRDGDGIMDSLDACPDQGDQGDGLGPNGCPKSPPDGDGDRDGDGILDNLDACPDQGDQGYGLSPDGCPKPPPDSDSDGVPDHQDKCPNEGDQGYGLYSDGCPKPPPDGDGDGVPDHLDACPNQGSQGYGVDSDGCPLPPPDRDGDGVPDNLDACPNQGDQGYGLKSNGCPYDPKDNIEICFNGQTHSINREKLQEWLKRGATEGACP